MAQRVVIANPIINSPFTEPTRHFQFDDEGITDQLIERRRPSSYFIPIAQPKKKGKNKQLALDNEWTADRIEENQSVNSIRERVRLWHEWGIGKPPALRDGSWNIGGRATAPARCSSARSRRWNTNFNGESFFVRHAYFTGADQPYDKLKRALKAEIDEDAWSALYSTTSRPFPKPESGQFAVKVVNHYGDEVLKVYSV